MTKTRLVLTTWTPIAIGCLAAVRSCTGNSNGHLSLGWSFCLSFSISVCFFLFSLSFLTRRFCLKKKRYTFLYFVSIWWFETSSDSTGHASLHANPNWSETRLSEGQIDGIDSRNGENVSLMKKKINIWEPVDAASKINRVTEKKNLNHYQFSIFKWAHSCYTKVIFKS